MVLILIVITNQIICIRVNERGVYKRIDEMLEAMSKLCIMSA